MVNRTYICPERAQKLIEGGNPEKQHNAISGLMKALHDTTKPVEKNLSLTEGEEERLVRSSEGEECLEEK